MHTTNASYGSGFAPLETPLVSFGGATTSIVPGAIVGALPTMSHDRNYPYRAKLRPQILTTGHADTKRVVFEKEFPSVIACHSKASPFTGEGTRHVSTHSSADFVSFLDSTNACFCIIGCVGHWDARTRCS